MKRVTLTDTEWQKIQAMRKAATPEAKARKQRQYASFVAQREKELVDIRNYELALLWGESK